MTPALLLLLIPQLFVRTAVAVASVDDEQCLLQTSIDTKTQRSVSRHFESPAEPVVEPQKEPFEVPEFVIDLDKPPEERFTEVSKKFGPAYNEFYEKFMHQAGILASVKKIASMRGPENEELMGEVKGISKDIGMPQYWVHAQQILPELFCLKGPFMKFVDGMDVPLPEDKHIDKDTASATEFLDTLQVPSFGNTGIIAKDKDGSVWHARNQGMAMPGWLQKFTYDAKFIKDGNELFTATMIFPSVSPKAAVRKGKNGYSFQPNTRYLDKQEDGMMLMKNLYMERRSPAQWQARKVLEDTDNYDDALKAFSTMSLPAPLYIIMSGVKKGAVLARDPDSVAKTMELDEKHPHVVMTNFDYFDGDKKEWLMPTRVKGLSARVRAQNLLDQSSEVTPELLQNVLNDRDVLSKNVFYQSMVNIEHGKSKTVFTHCSNCD